MAYARFIGAALAVIATATAISPAAAQLAPEGDPIKPFYGSLDPFYGSIDPFYGSLDPFWGSLDPFYGNIDPFYGNLDPFWGSLDPFWGSLDPFQGTAATAPAFTSIGPYWREFGTFWTETSKLWDVVSANPLDLLKKQELNSRLSQMVSRAAVVWGAAVTQRTGKSFNDGFVAPLLAKHGINPSDPNALARLSPAQRKRLVVDWYDGLMGYSGVDHVDHWMATVDWRPSITQQQGSGRDSIIGLLDGAVAGDADLLGNIVYSGGYAETIGGHGTGVASLMVAEHDGRGVMGIAPKASVVAHNPFDATGTASWADVRRGIVALDNAGASVINMSFGVSGWTLHPDWKTVFNSAAVAAIRDDTVFVIAAGNDGVTQLLNVPWSFETDPAMIIVGSVDPSGQISSFSNRPGTACLTAGLLCQSQNRLMNRFIVAPGELILVSDGQGGVVRQTGTSFAAPLVSGAITLLHDRWPWLAQHPKETVEIILSSARDLGAPGTDPVYGRGLLDVEASQSPLNFANLTYKEVRNGSIIERSAAQVKLGGIQTSWEADGVYFQMYEKIGATFRDFNVPLSTRLVGQVMSAGGTMEYFQRYAEKRLKDWIKTGFTDVVAYAAPRTSGWQLAVSSSSPEEFLAYRDQAPHSAVRISDPSSRFAFSAGYGHGAMALAGVSGFGLSSDYSADGGGVNPVLGLASGGAFVGTDIALSPNTTIAAGLTQRRFVHSKAAEASPRERQALEGMTPYEASAINLQLTHRASKALAFTAGYARLDEADGLLGVQSTDASDLHGGTTTDTATFGATLSLRSNLTIAATATTARTRSSDRQDRSLNVAGDGVWSSAYALAVSKQGVLGRRDLMRFTATQPLHVESGELDYTSVQVVDRLTGETAPVTSRFDISGRVRRFAGEMLYAAPVLGGSGELSLFGRAEFQAGGDSGREDYVFGGRLGFTF